MSPEYERILMTQIDNLNAENDQLKARVRELEEENERLSKQLNYVVDAVIDHRIQAESGHPLNAASYALWDKTADQQKRRIAEIRGKNISNK